MTITRKLFIAAAASGIALSAFALPQVNPQKAWRPVKKSAPQKAVAATPKILNDKVIVCGNKKLQLSHDGKLVLSNAAKKIATIIPFVAYTNKVENKIDWLAFNSELCTVSMKDGKVVWVLNKKIDGKTFKIAEQTLEVLPDGLLKLSAQYENIDTPTRKLRSSGAVFVNIPLAGNEGRKVIFNDSKELEISKALKHGEWKPKKLKYQVFPDSPVDTFAVHITKPETGSLALGRVGSDLRISCGFNKELSGAIYIDLRKAGIEKIDAANTGAGVNFKQIEDLELPYVTKNLLLNSSFEQNLLGWTTIYGFLGRVDYDEKRWNSDPFRTVKGGFHGSHALRIKGRFATDRGNYRHLEKGTNLSSPTVFLNAGKYTISFYAKQISGKPCYLNVWCHNFNNNTSPLYLPPHPSGKMTTRLTNEWKRYSFTMTNPKACPTAFSFNVNGVAEVLLDAVQVEKGTRMTAYTSPAAEGLLITDTPDNFISAKDKVNARVRIFTSPSVSGKVAVRVKNFFGEVVYTGTKNFKADSKGYAVVALPFENFGKGIFTVRFDYTLADGRKSSNHTRYAVADYLNNTHRLKNLFSEDFFTLEGNHLFLKLLDRYRKAGFGAKTHMYNWDKKIWDKYLEYGVEPLDAFMVTNLHKPGTTKTSNFAIKFKGGKNVTTNPNILIGDHNLSNNGEFDEAYLQKFTDAVATIAKRYPHVKRWAMQGEVRAKYPKEWWSKEGTEEEASRRHALYLKAFVAGVHKGNPTAKVYQDDPCNMRPDGGIAETRELLLNCNKHGVRFDLLAIHPYRFSPESPDLDSDAKLFFDKVKEAGYGDDVKVMWPEMMHWGPYNIPQWGTDSSTWGSVPRTWPGWALSYDIGATERLSAAWRTRAYLVALKYSDRILTATSGGILNNFHMDEELTPYSSVLVPNTLGNLLGDSKFAKDVRFAPFCRAYIYTDQDNRPVAAVWCHLDKVDYGYIDAPQAEADFGNILEDVIDMMNNKRAFNSGKYQFPVSSFPLFLRGKPGTLKQMIAAFEKAEIVSGDGISPLEVSWNPSSAKNVKVTFKNLLSRDFEGTFNGKAVKIPASGVASVEVPASKPLTSNAVSRVDLPGVFKSTSGQRFDYDLSFEAMTAKRVPESFTFENAAWNKIPAAKFQRNMSKKETSGDFRIGWNSKGIFIQVQVKDKKFTHTEYQNTVMRYRNDCLQVYFDTMANGRYRQFKGYDEDDYDYAVFPNSKGNCSIVWRNRSVEQQLGLATQAPQDMTVAHDIPSSFSSKNGVLTYRVFFPAKYLLPIKLRAGWVFGFGLYAANVDVPRGPVTSALTLSTAGKACYNVPHTYPAVLLVD